MKWMHVNEKAVNRKTNHFLPSAHPLITRKKLIFSMNSRWKHIIGSIFGKKISSKIYRELRRISNNRLLPKFFFCCWKLIRNLSVVHVPSRYFFIKNLSEIFPQISNEIFLTEIVRQEFWKIYKKNNNKEDLNF